MMKQLIISILTLFSFAVHSQPTNKEYDEALRIVDVWLDAQRDFELLPGMSISIVNDQEIIFSKGYGYADTEHKVPMQPETIFSICSISKLFTSVAIMQLWEQGKIRLDDSISAILPGYNLRQQYVETVPISIRSLLTHSSGLPREAAYAYWSAPDYYFPTLKEMNQKLGSQQTLYPSSTFFQYSNLGMSLLGEAVAAVAKTSYENYVTRNILQPMKLANTQPYLPKNLWRTKLATGYSSLYRDGTRKMMPFFQANGIAAAAGYSSTVVDLAKFASWQFRVLAGNNKEILRSSTLKEMQRVHWMNPDGKLTWGLGFTVLQEGNNTYVGHGGSCPGYRSALRVSPKNKIGVAMMINAQGTDPEKYISSIFELLGKVKEPNDTASVAVDLNDFVGSYDNYTWGGEYVAMPWKGKLAMFTLPSDNPAATMQLFKYMGNDSFRRIRKDEDMLGEELRFERDARGKVVRLLQHDNFKEKLK
jgi:CubicO group peptidase (beta-lactamase class C family)